MITVRTMTDAALVDAIGHHPFVHGIDDEHVALLAELSRPVTIPAGDLVLEHDRPAETMFLLLEGDVALEIWRAGRPPLVLETLHGGDTLGWSWLFPPYTWHLDAHAVTRVHAIAVDAVLLLAALLDDPPFASVVTRRVAGLAVDRLQHARMQLALVDA